MNLHEKDCADVQFTFWILSLKRISVLNTFLSIEWYLAFYLTHSSL